ncbi:hypothetical protein HDU76_014057 [Blyttiomyces sp. JEL0837]|nr:hypothetical protein HDU76_014057 [Blyttiomyces sp. JEL0837]
MTNANNQQLADHIAGLESQLAQLRDILLNGGNADNATIPAPASVTQTSASESLTSEVAKLKEENEKLQYRIKILLRTAAAKQQKIEELSQR